MKEERYYVSNLLKKLTPIVFDKKKFGGYMYIPEKDLFEYEGISVTLEERVHKGLFDNYFKRLETTHKLINKDPVLKYLYDNEVSFELVGGAVYDIEMGNTPKDYDFLSLKITDDMKFVDTSKTADTYRLEVRKNVSYTLQVLKTKKEDFDFTVSQCHIKYYTYDMDYSPLYSFLSSDIKDNLSFKNKLLIPASYKPKNALQSLYRIPHWKKKGMHITDNTYYSLLNSAFNSNKPIKQS